MLSSPGLQLKPDTSDPFDALNFPSSQYPYAFEVFGNNGSTPRGARRDRAPAITRSRTSLMRGTVLGDIQQFGSGSTSTGSDHYPIVGDYIISGVPEPSSFVLAAFGFTAWTASQIRSRRNVLFAVPTG